VNLDVILWFSGTVAEAVVVGLLLYRRVWQTLPVFFAYNVWTLIGSTAAYVILHDYHAIYLISYIAAAVVDSALLFGVLVELGLSLLRPIRSSLPRIAPLIVGTLVLAVGGAIWPFASVPGSNNVPHALGVMWHLQQTFSILRISIFLVLAGGSQLFSIGWRDRELQVATGLGFYSIVSVAVAMLHAHQTVRAQYSHLDRIVVASSICSLLYWFVSFAQKEAERRAFTPQMQSMLLAVAGAARSTRVALEDSHGGDARKQEKR
jgi:hypothetical protein